MGQEQTIPEPVWATLRPPKHQKRSAHIVLRHRPSILTDFARLLLLLANLGKEDKPEPMCPCGCGPVTMIGEDVSERLDVVPAQFRVLVTRRPKYGSRRCSGAVAQAHAPEHVVTGGLPTEALIAQVIVAKFGDNLLFYRPAESYARQGIALHRAALGNWPGRACFHLQPIADHMSKHLAVVGRIFMDEMTAPDLDPGSNKEGLLLGHGLR